MTQTRKRIDWLPAPDYFSAKGMMRDHDVIAYTLGEARRYATRLVAAAPGDPAARQLLASLGQD